MSSDSLRGDVGSSEVDLGVDEDNSESGGEEDPSVGLLGVSHKQRDSSNRAVSRTMEARAEHMKLRHYKSLYAFTTSLGIGLLVMVLVWATKYGGGFAWNNQEIALKFNWHPVLMVLGLIFMYGQSILIYRTLRHNKKPLLKVTHAIINGLAFIFAVIALKAVFDSHNLAEPPKPNLYTMHSWIGLTAVILFSAQFALGFASFLYPGFSKQLREFLLPVHVSVGVGTFILAGGATLTGLAEKAIFSLDKTYKDLPSEGVLLNTCSLFAVFYVIMVLYLVNRDDYKRIEIQDDGVSLTSN